MRKPIPIKRKPKARKKQAQIKVDLINRTDCIKCNTVTELNINGLCVACQNGRRHGSKE